MGPLDLLNDIHKSVSSIGAEAKKTSLAIGHLIDTSLLEKSLKLKNSFEAVVDTLVKIESSSKILAATGVFPSIIARVKKDMDEHAKLNASYQEEIQKSARIKGAINDTERAIAKLEGRMITAPTQGISRSISKAKERLKELQADFADSQREAAERGRKLEESPSWTKKLGWKLTKQDLAVFGLLGALIEREDQFNAAVGASAPNVELRNQLYAETNKLQAATGVSYDKILGVESSLIKFGMQRRADWSSTLNTATKLVGYMGLSAESASELAATSAAAKQNFSDTADSIANIVANTSVGVDKATQLAIQFNKLAILSGSTSVNVDALTTAAAHVLDITNKAGLSHGILDAVIGAQSDYGKSLALRALTGVNVLGGDASAIPDAIERLIKTSTYGPNNPQGNLLSAQILSGKLGQQIDPTEFAQLRTAIENGTYNTAQAHDKHAITDDFGINIPAIERLTNSFKGLLNYALTPLNNWLTNERLTAIEKWMDGVGNAFKNHLPEIKEAGKVITVVFGLLLAKGLWNFARSILGITKFVGETLTRVVPETYSAVKSFFSPLRDLVGFFMRTKVPTGQLEFDFVKNLDSKGIFSVMTRLVSGIRPLFLSLRLLGGGLLEAAAATIEFWGPIAGVIALIAGTLYAASYYAKHGDEMTGLPKLLLKFLLGPIAPIIDLWKFCSRVITQNMDVIRGINAVYVQPFINWIVKSIKWMVSGLVDGIKSVANWVVKLVGWILPKNFVDQLNSIGSINMQDTHWMGDVVAKTLGIDRSKYATDPKKSGTPGSPDVGGVAATAVDDDTLPLAQLEASRKVQDAIYAQMKETRTHVARMRKDDANRDTEEATQRLLYNQPIHYTTVAGKKIAVTS